MSDEGGTLLAEFPAATAVAVTAFAAALLGTVFGIAVSRRLRGADAPDSTTSGSAEREAADLVSWTRLSRVEAQLDESRRELDLLKRDYELDTGLLRQEIQRLELLLGRFAPRPKEPDVEPPSTEGQVRPGYYSLRLVDPLAAPAGTMTFSSLASLGPHQKERASSHDA